MIRLAFAGLLAFAFTAAFGTESKTEKAAAPYIGHMVYFKLKDGSPEARKKFIDSCDALLSDHPGTVYYSTGVLAGEFKGQFNDREFDVALTLVFDSKDAHDKYQVSEKHTKFVNDNKAAMEKVRVFDSEHDGKKVKLGGK
ncbi:MAG: Dabb family protein [Gemmataceae bacterium]